MARVFPIMEGARPRHSFPLFEDSRFCSVTSSRIKSSIAGCQPQRSIYGEIHLEN